MDGRQAQTADLLHSAAIHLLRRASEADDESGLSRARLSALSVVVFRGPLTLGALADAEGVTSATMSVVARGLEVEGLVRRKPHEEDRRAILVEATRAGRRVLTQARRRRIEAVSAALEGLNRTALDTLWKAGNLLEDRFALPGRRWEPAERDRRATARPGEVSS